MNTNSAIGVRYSERDSYQSPGSADPVNTGDKLAALNSRKITPFGPEKNLVIENKFLKDASGEKKDTDFAQEKIDASMISSLLTAMFNKLDAANLKQVAAKLASTEVRVATIKKEKNKEFEEAEKSRAAAKAKEKEQQVMADIGLAFSVAFMFMSLAALAFVTGGGALAIGAAVISSVMTTMEVANRAIKYDDKATYTDSNGKKQHIEISIAGAVNVIVDEAIKAGAIYIPPEYDTKEKREKYLADVKMGLGIAFTLAVTITTVALSIGNMKQAFDAVKDTSGTAAKAVAGYKMAVTSTLESVETAGQIASASVDAAKADSQLKMADNVYAANMAENKANAFSFQADMLSKEGRQAKEAMSRHSEIIKKQIAVLKKVQDALMEMDSKIVNV